MEISSRPDLGFDKTFSNAIPTNNHSYKFRVQNLRKKKQEGPSLLFLRTF